jgi:hypothetical protein
MDETQARILRENREARLRLWRTACQGKQAFESRAIASRVARRYQNQYYKCRGCNKWHTGELQSTTPRRKIKPLRT